MGLIVDVGKAPGVKSRCILWLEFSRMKKIVLLSVLLLIALGTSVYTEEIGGLSTVLSPVKFGGKKLPSWLSSDYAPIFNGVNQYASANLATNPATGAYTVMGWCKPYNTTSLTQRIFDTNPDNAYLSWSGAIYFFVTPNQTGQIQPPTLTVGNWVHLSIVYSGATSSLYINGALNKQAVATAGASFGTTFDFGRRSALNTQQLNGSLAEWSIWNRALSQDEILRYKDKRLKGTETGLVALYHMNDNSQTLIDSVGGKNAIASNTIQWTRRNGYSAPDVRSERYALIFDGVDDYASGSCTISTYPVTLESWCFVPSLAANQYTSVVALASSVSSTDRTRVIIFNNNNGIVTAFFSTPSSESGYAIPGGLVGWAHVAFVLESPTSRKMFFNGSQVGTGSSEDVFSFQKNIYIGRFSSAASFGKGKSAEVRIWSTARTQAEIQANLYTQMTGSETGLVYYYRGNEGTGSTLTNLGSAGSAGNLTLYNSPTWVGRDIP